MPLSKIMFLCFLLPLVCLECSRQPQTPPFEFSVHNIKLKFESETDYLSVADTISVQFHKNVDHVYFFLYDSFKVNKVCIGNQDLALENISIKTLRGMGPLTETMQQIIDSSQIVQFAIPKSLYPKSIQVWYSGPVDWRDLNRIAWHPLLPGVKSTFELAALLPAQFEPRGANKLTLLRRDEGWSLWHGEDKNPKQFCELTLEPTKLMNSETDMK